VNERVQPAARWKKRAVLGGIAVFVLSLFLFFSPMLGLVKHNFVYLPHLGEKETIAVERDGRMVVDTIYYKVPPFSFTDQFGRTITDADVAGKIRVVDFFFTRCTTICPRMSVQMQQLQLKLNDPAFKDVVFLSHTVDPEHDTPEVLATYARKLEADTARWKFLTGAAPDIYRMGNMGYLLSAMKGEKGSSNDPFDFEYDPAPLDSSAAEEFLHDSRFVLVDKQGHIRGFYEGTEAEGMNALAADLKMLMKEEKIRASEKEKARRRGE
jgi:protein SCO1/2